MNKLFEEDTCLRQDEIKRYLSARSSREEQRRVENHLLDCPLCADALEGFRTHYDFDQHTTLESLRQDVQPPEEPAEQAPKVVEMKSGAPAAPHFRATKRRHLLTFNRIAAAIVLLVVSIAGWRYSNQPTTDNGPIVNVSPSLTMRTSSGDLTPNTALINAIELYDAQQYDAALGLTEDILENSPNNHIATYYAGLSALAAKYYELAAHYFMTLRINSERHYEEATWLMIQSCLGAEKKNKALELLDDVIADPSGSYYKEAVLLKKRLVEEQGE